MEAISRFLAALMVPLFLLNSFGGIVSGVWLAFLGEWAIIGYGLLVIILASAVIGIVLAPSMFLAKPALTFMEQGRLTAALLMGVLGRLYTVGVLSFWCILVLIYYIEIATSETLLPLLLWSYGVATGPITWLTQKDMQSGNDASIMTTAFIQISYVICAVGAWLGDMSLHGFVIVFAVLMSITAVAELSLAFIIDRNRSFRL
ncbi:hypothetical protein [Emcibacter sp.]|uniref:hypothetical protein n=1 Tax=Emcibacter sp. TaxID=1979954 RepID=UPI002AA7ADA1|nr:hypothetical protein [Emcibacter sp.]